MGDDRISDEAVRKATGRDWQTWFRFLDGRDAASMDHAAIARMLGDETDLSGWWCQMVTVQYERARGLRAVGQAAGGWQCSVQKTVDLGAAAAWETVMSGAWLPGVRLEEGAQSEVDGERVVVRAVRPRLLRLWWYHAEGRSTLEVGVDPKEDRSTIRFTHHALPAEGMKESYRTRWKAALEGLAP